jgi:DNA invertase Pin-like site-specific DNA recombinase
MPANQSIKAAVYFRMSTDKQEHSVDRQRSQVIPHAEKHGYVIVGEYIDEGIAGDEIRKRKEFQRLLRDAQAGLFSAILCDDKDRFGRFDSIDAGEIIAPLRRKGVWVDTVAQGKIDWESFAGRVTDAVLQEAKSMESDALSRRVLSMQLLAAQNGGHNGGKAPYGLRLEPDPLRGKVHVPDGHKAEVVRYVFRRYDEGATLGQIARELKERGVRSPTGNLGWTRTVLWKMLANRKYLGDLPWGVRPSGKRHRHGGGGKLTPARRHEKTVKRLPPGQWVVRENNHEAIIDRDLFERVQAKLSANQKRTTPHTDGGPFVLTRMMVCGHCGSFMVGFTHKGSRVYSCGGYKMYGKNFCNANIVTEDAIVRIFLRELQKLFLDPANLQKLRDEIKRRQEAMRSQDNLGQLQKQAAVLDKKIQAGAERLLEVPREVVAEAAAALAGFKAERDRVAKEIEAAQKATPMADLEKQIADAEAVLWSIQDALTAEDYPLLRQLLREAFEKVELFWTHEVRGKSRRNMSRLERGVIYMRTQDGVRKLLHSADRGTASHGRRFPPLSP